MVKVISISDEAYAELSRFKGMRSFSQTILHIIGELNKGTDYETIGKLAGAFSEDKEYWEETKKEIYRRRKESKVRPW